MQEALNVFAAVVALGAWVGTVAAYWMSVLVLMRFEPWSQRIAPLSDLWAVIASLHVMLFAIGQAMIVVGSEPTGTAMGTGLMLFFALVVAFPWAILTSLLALLIGTRNVKVRVLLWYVGLGLATLIMQLLPETTGPFLGLAVIVASTIVPAVGLKQSW